MHQFEGHACPRIARYVRTTVSIRPQGILHLTMAGLTLKHAPFGRAMPSTRRFNRHRGTI